MNRTKEIRIYVFDQFQYSIQVPDSQTIQETARKAQEVMKLQHLRPSFAPGLVNLVPDLT